MKDIIIELLNIEPDLIQECTTVRTEDSLNVYLTLKVQTLYCSCNTDYPLKFKEYYTKSLHHNLLMDIKTIIKYRARRYQCPVCRKTQYEPNPFSSTYEKKSYSLSLSVITKLKRPEMTFSSVAKELNVSVTTVINTFDQLVNNARKQLPKVLCIDELYYSRHASYKYCCLFVDFETKQLIEMFESRQKLKMIHFLDAISEHERNRVEIICIDMYEPYRTLVHRRFKNARLCVDKFHLIQLANDKLNEVRLRILKLYKNGSIEYYLLKKFRFVLFKSEEYDINQEPKFNRKLNGYYNYARLLHTLLQIDMELKKAYEIRKQIQYFLEIQTTNTQQLQHQFDALIVSIKQSEVVEMLELVSTLNNWRSEILNSFIWINGRRVSNGPIEAINAIVKKIKNNANGYRNFKRFRARAFLVINKELSFKTKSAKNLIRMKGIARGPYKKHQE